MISHRTPNDVLQNTVSRGCVADWLCQHRSNVYLMIPESGHLIIILLHPLAGSKLWIFQHKIALFPVSLFRRGGGKKLSSLLLYFFFWGVGNVINIQTQRTGRLSDATLKNVEHTSISNNAVVIVTLLFCR